MAVLFGLLAAASYGAGDFFGGLASKRVAAITVVLYSQLFGSALVLSLLPTFGGVEPTGSTILWGLAAGLSGSTGAAFLYRGLAIGRMSVVAPITGVLGASLPVVFGLAIGERPSPIALVGVVAGLIAVALVSTAPQEAVKAAGRGRGIPEAFGAGLGFAVFFICLDRTDPDSGMWPLFAARIASIGLMTVVAAFSGNLRLGRGREVLGIIVAGSVLEVLATVFYLLGVREGLLALVAVLTSLYPVGTVALARVFLKERLVAVQLVGLGFAVGAVVLIGMG
jgi:drug/metabolite transporter (DMT)-like permease